MCAESLSPREIEVLRQVADGNRNRDIAEKLSTSEETVKVHVKHIMDKLGASDRTQAIAIAVRRGIIQLIPRRLGRVFLRRPGLDRHSDQRGNQDCDVELPDERFGDGQRSRDRVDRLHIAVANGSEGYKAKVHQFSGLVR
jgi:DNA-binding CsgD family transcriptional regulator